MSDFDFDDLLVTVIGTFMTLLDMTVVNIALPTITRVFGVRVIRWPLTMRTLGRYRVKSKKVPGRASSHSSVAP